MCVCYSCVAEGGQESWFARFRCLLVDLQEEGSAELTTAARDVTACQKS